MKGQRIIDAGTLETIWLRAMLHQYSLPVTFVFKYVEMAGVAAIDEENIKKQRNVSKRT